MDRRTFTSRALCGLYLARGNSRGAQTRVPGGVLIRGAQVFDGEESIGNRSVLIQGGRIVRIDRGKLLAEGVDVIEADGMTLLPGLIDAHVHVGEDVKGALAQCLTFGVTTVIDMFNYGGRFEKMKAIRSDDPSDTADLRTAGLGASAPGGHPSQMGGGPIPTISDPADAQRFVDARLAEGSDFIKIIYDDLETLLGQGKSVPKLSPGTLRALIEAAHRRNALAVVHISSEKHAREVAEAGADGLAHIFIGESSSGRLGQVLAKNKLFVIPTLSTLYAACGESAGPSLLSDSRLEAYLRGPWRSTLERAWPGAKPSCNAARQGLPDLVRAKVPILAGTDAPAPGTTYGASLHGELALLVKGGLSSQQALAAATSLPAKTFRMVDRGRIAVGMRADLLLVEGNPLKDIEATRNIRGVWKRGVRAIREKRL